MEQDIVELDSTKTIKTYSSLSKNMANKEHENKDKQIDNNVPITREPLTTKNAVKFLLEGTLNSKVCRACMNISNVLYDLDQVFHIAGHSALYKVTVRDMVAAFYPFKIINDKNHPNRMCEKCLNHTISSYLFTQQLEQSDRAFRNCFDDIAEKFDKLDPLDPPKKRGRQKFIINHNIINVEHPNVIDYADPIYNLINIGSESMADQAGLFEFECNKCAQVLPNLESLMNHEKIHPKTMWYNCRLCGKSFAKINQLKRHIKGHTDGQLPKPVPNMFVCNTCGYNSDVYVNYLQHIEKHKFKTVMEHVVGRKTDSLCTVCLDNGKGEEMVDLNQTVSLHGGIPELTGERSLYNILGSTLPDSTMNKYRELHIVNQANVLPFKIWTAKIYKPDVTQKQDDNFAYSSPVILSTENTVCEDCIFTFADPIKGNNILKAKKTPVVDVLEGETIMDDLGINLNDQTEIESESVPTTEPVETTKNKPKEHESSTDNITAENNKHIFAEPLNVTDTKENKKSTTKDKKSELSSTNNQKSETDHEYDIELDLFGGYPSAAIPIHKKYLGFYSLTPPSEPKINVEHQSHEQFCETLKNVSRVDRSNDRIISNSGGPQTFFKTNGCQSCVIIGHQCFVCARKNKSNNANVVRDPVPPPENKDVNKCCSGKCDYCWIFRKLDRCEICKIPTKKIASNKSIPLSDVLREIGRKDVGESTPKGKKLEKEVVIIKERSWLCEICLTHNINREECFYCESKIIGKGCNIFNFKRKIDSNEASTSGYKRPTSNTTEPNLPAPITTSIEPKLIPITNSTLTESRNDNISIEAHNIPIVEVIEMDTESDVDINIPKTTIIDCNTEEMEVEDSENPPVILHPPHIFMQSTPQSNPVIPNPNPNRFPITFNIGMSSTGTEIKSNTRKIYKNVVRRREPSK